MEVVEESDWALSEEGFAVQRRLWVRVESTISLPSCSCLWIQDETVNVLKGVSPKFSQVVDQYL